MAHLGSLTDLMELRTNELFIQLMVEFWDQLRLLSNSHTLRLHPLCKKLVKLLTCRWWDGHLWPHRLLRKAIFSAQLRVGPGLRMVKAGWVILGYHFERFGWRESYKRFQSEFFFSRIDWERQRAIIFIVSFLGIMMFLMRGNQININLLLIVSFMCRGSPRVTIMSMILAEIFRSLSACSRGYKFFRGCNLMLQVWALEQFYRRNMDNDTRESGCNQIFSHKLRMNMWDVPNNKEE